MIKGKENIRYQTTQFIPSNAYKNLGIFVNVIGNKLPNKRNYLFLTICKFTYTNGNAINIPEEYVEEVYDKYCKTILKNQGSTLDLKNNNIRLITKKSKPLRKQKSQQRPKEETIQTMTRDSNGYIEQLPIFFHQIILYFELTKLLTSRACLNLTNFVMNRQDELLYLSKKLKIRILKQKLKFREQISSIISRRKDIKVTNSCTKNMEITLILEKESLHQKQKKTITDILRIINQELGLILKQLLSEHSGDIYQIKQITQLPKYGLEIIGGVSTVKRMYIQSIQFNKPHDLDGKKHRKKILLAKKQLKLFDADDDQYQNSRIRFQREIKMIEHIIKSNSLKFYLMDYFTLNNNPNAVYSDWEELSLVSYLQAYKGRFTIQQMIDLSIQIVLIVLDLNSCGIVHRDLKPSNFMVRFKPDRLYPILKLIDFGDSFQIDGDTQQIMNDKYKLYSTPLYCPPETSTFNDDYYSKGLNKQKIDNWSIGIIIYQIFFGTLPISYSSAMTKDIQTLWRFQFMNHIDLKYDSQIDNTKHVIGMLSFELLKMNQYDRISLESVLSILLLYQRHTKQIKKVICNVAN